MTTSSGSKSLTTWLKKKIRPALSLQGSVAAYHRSPRHEVCNTQIVYCSNLEQIKNYSPKLSYALHNKLNLNKQLLRFVFPVMCVDGTVVLIVTKEALYEDAVGSLQLKLIEQGYQLNERSYLITDAAILLAARRILPSGEKELKQQHRSESYSMAQWSEAELHAMFIELVRWGVENEASDLHINLNLSAQFSDVLYTIAGRYIRPRVFHSIQTKLLKDMLAVVWMGIQGGNAAVFDAYQEQQGRLECQVNGQTVRLRWASLAALDGPSVCIRILKKQDKSRLTLKQLGYLPEQEKQLLEGALSERGAIIFSGSVGSGKSTALAALVRELPLWRKIITLEDPVEYRIPNAIQVSIARQLDGDSEQHFSTKLRALKRSAMSDVILGEIRDPETAQAFTDLTTSGVRVYTTLHAAGAKQIIQRLSSSFLGIDPQILNTPGVLRLLVHQELLPKLCPQCALPIKKLQKYPNHTATSLYQFRPFKQWQKQLKSIWGDSYPNLRIRNAKGCDRCQVWQKRGLGGYLGRTIVAELFSPEYKELFKPIHYTAWFKASKGFLDPMDLELYFGVFERAHWQRFSPLEVPIFNAVEKTNFLKPI